MSDHVFECEGASAPRSWSAIAERHSLGGPDGSASRIDFGLQMPGPLLGSLSDRARDLVRIAAYVYLADGSVSRGGKRDVYGLQWRRRMLMAIPVSEPDFWRGKDISRALEQALSFLTEDDWRFHFTSWKRSAESQLQLIATDASLHGSPGCVVLFSGGADSLAACIAAHREGARPLLVSHHSSPLTAGPRRRLMEELRSHFSTTGFLQASAIVHRRGSDAPETSQRSRSFLFASLGAAAARALGVDDVRLADNGFVSINLPITDQAVGAQASRTTHPKYLRLVSELVSLSLERDIEVRNPLLFTTRAEALVSLRDAGAEELLGETRSCVHPRGRPNYAPHCGHCSQCVDRRFGVLAAGMEEYDTSYETDIFTDELAEGEPRVIATTYLRHALRLDELPEDEVFFSEFPQLYDCLTGQRPDEQARELVAMLKRHAKSVTTAMREQVRRHADELIRPGGLPPTCLVRLVPIEDSARRGTASQWTNLNCSPDYASVIFEGRTYTLGPAERVGFRVLFEASQKGIPEVSGSHVLDIVLEEVETRPRSIAELFRRSGVFGKLVIQGSRRGVYRLIIDSGMSGEKSK